MTAETYANPRSGNPAVRAAAEREDNVTALEAEAAGSPYSFEWAGRRYQLLTKEQGFKLTRFLRASERGQNTDAIEMAIGAEQYKLIEDDIEDLQDFVDVIELVSEAMGVGDLEKAAASQRSSTNRPRPRR